MQDFNLGAPAGRALRPDRAERRGEDDRLQPADRRLPARRRDDPARRARPHRAASRIRSPSPGCPGRSRTSASSPTCRCWTTCGSPATCAGSTRSSRRSCGFPKQQAEERAILERSRRLLTLFELDDRREEEARSLPYGDQRRLEIARALATEPEGRPARRARGGDEPEGDARAGGADPPAAGRVRA